jgi:hypothetical protein
MAVHVGDQGTSASPLQPQGVVLINGERLDARAEFGLIETGCEVVVVTGDHMGLIVRKLEPGTSPQFPNHGQKLCTSFDERVAEESERTEAERCAWLDGHRRNGTLMGGTGGAAASAIASWQLRDTLAELGDSPWAIAALVVAAGAILGIVYFRFIDEALGQVDPNFRRVTIPSTILALIGMAAGSILAIPTLGIAVGLLVGVAAAILFAAAPVVLILFTGGVGGG